MEPEELNIEFKFLTREDHLGYLNYHIVGFLNGEEIGRLHFVNDDEEYDYAYNHYYNEETCYNIARCLLGESWRGDRGEKEENRLLQILLDGAEAEEEKKKIDEYFDEFYEVIKDDFIDVVSEFLDELVEEYKQDFPEFCKD